MIFEQVQAHLVLSAALFLMLTSLGWKYFDTFKLALASTLPFATIDGLSLAEIVRSLTHNLSISLVVLLIGLVLASRGIIQLSPRHHVSIQLAVVVAALCLYPASLGLSYVDPYRWGYQPNVLLGVTAVVVLYFIFTANYLGASMLALATLAYALRIESSTNYWNYLIDPVLVIYSAFGCLRHFAKCVRQYFRRAISKSRAARYFKHTERGETDR